MRIGPTRDPDVWHPIPPSDCAGTRGVGDDVWPSRAAIVGLVVLVLVVPVTVWLIRRWPLV